MPYKDPEKARAANRASSRRYREKNREKSTEQMCRWRARNPDYFRTHAIEWRIRKPLNYLLNNIASRAKRLGIAFDLKADNIAVPTHCPWLGIPLVWRSPDRDQWPSIDRKNPKGGYTLDNIEVISWRANTIKSSASLDELVRMGKIAHRRGGKA